MDEIASAMEEYATVLEPDENTPEWWAGAPSVVRADDGAFYMAARMREGDSPRGMRGYEIRILRSDDGRRFEPIHHIRREDAGVPGFERPALVQDPESGMFKLYGCADTGRGWSILKFDDAGHPSEFKGQTARPVIVADYPDDEFAHVRGYKDPFVFNDNGIWRLFAIGYDNIERAYHFESEDGEIWTRVGGPVLENTDWHNFYTRPASVLPMPVGYLLVYEGSSVEWRDPAYNIATGLAYSPDLEQFVDLTPDEPLLTSRTPGAYHTWRYSHWLRVDGRILVYFEAARPNNTNEIRMASFAMPTG